MNFYESINSAAAKNPRLNDVHVFLEGKKHRSGPGLVCGSTKAIPPLERLRPNRIWSMCQALIRF